MISLRRKLINKYLIESISDIKDGKILDIGSEKYGHKFFLSNFKGKYTTIDIDKGVNPDIIASVDDMPF